jgi:hypothetical protein
MLYPLSCEGLRCPFAQHAGRVSVRRAPGWLPRADGLCRTCAACRGVSFSLLAPDTRRRSIRLLVSSQESETAE